jgi:hypothetical protein
MNSVIGFSLLYQLPSQRSERALAAQNTALGYFKHLQRQSFSIGDSRLELWGHNDLNERVHYLPDGTLLALIGSPLGKASLPDVGEQILNAKNITDLELPWDGRTILLRISADGKRWIMWNDWLGSIPVFHTKIGDGRIASTLEPVTVAAAGYTPDDFFLPGLVSLLINGHYLSDWTLYKDMKVIPPDSASTWDEKGFSVKQLWSVQPTQSRWEAGWDDLVDEMHEMSRKAVTDALKTQSRWILPLSSGLDSRLIAAVAAEVGVDATAYAWGAPNTTDVVYSRQIAKTLGFPWKRIDLPDNFLKKYTHHWANWFGSTMHFHGMYQMAFLDEIVLEPSAPIISGFIGDVLAGDSIKELVEVHSSRKSYQLESDWYCHWTVNEVRSHAKFPLADALEANAEELKKQIDSLPGAFYQKLQFLELHNRQRHFTSFQATLADYWRGVANPFMSRDYARFCLSIPRMALDNRQLLSGVFRRYYGRLAVIPGTYAQEPFILTGKYLLLRKIAGAILPALHKGPLKGFGNVQLRMDIASVQSTGKAALWPLFDTLDQLAEWVDIEQLERDYQTIMRSQKDIRPLRRLQSVQTLAFRLLNSTGMSQ